MGEIKAIQKNIKLTLDFDRYAIRHMSVYNKVPFGAWLIMTDDKDPLFNKETRSWVKRIPKKKVVEAYKVGRVWKIRPFVVAE